MNFFKKTKKQKPNERILQSFSDGLIFGNVNKDIKHIKKIVTLTESGYNKIEDKTNFKSLKEKDSAKQKQFLNKIMQENRENFDLERKKEIEELKKQNTFWFKLRSKLRSKLSLLKERMGEVWSFTKHEFLIIRKLMFFIYDLFFGKEYKNRKFFYGYKKKFIETKGYNKGEKRFNSMVRNITKSVELNKKLLKING